MGSIFNSYGTMSVCKFSYLQFCEPSVEIHGVYYALRGFSLFPALNSA